jgi:hypothetical protein
MIPKVKFVLPDSEYEVKMLECFTDPVRYSGEYASWTKYVFKHNPGLEDALKGTKTKQERLDAIWKNYARKALKDNKKELTARRKEFQDAWDTVNDDFMKAAESVMEHKWWLKTIKARVSLSTVNPRFLGDSSMGVCWKHAKDSFKKTIMHECVHFIYFKKFKEVFPDISEKTYNGHDSLVWMLSEILDSVILNQPEIRKFLNKDAGAYKIFGDRKLPNGKSAFIHFQDLFNRNRAKGLSFADNLKSCYKDAQKYKKYLKE